MNAPSTPGITSSEEHAQKLAWLRIDIWESIKNHVGRLQGTSRGRLRFQLPVTVCNENGGMIAAFEFDGRAAYDQFGNACLVFQDSKDTEKLIEILGSIEKM